MNNMNLAEWGDIIVFVGALAGSAVVCRQILRRAPKNTDSSGDKRYDELVMRSILPSNRGTSIDKVAEALKEQDLGGFALAGSKDGDRQ